VLPRSFLLHSYVLGLVKHGRRAHTSSIVTEAVSALGMHLVRGKEGASIGSGGTTKMKVTFICIYRAHDGRDGA